MVQVTLTHSLCFWIARVQRSKVEQSGGAGLLRKFGGRLKDALKSIFPGNRWFLIRLRIEYEWNDEKFKASAWEDPSTQRAFFDDLEKNLNIKKKEEWYSGSHSSIFVLQLVSQEEIIGFGGKGLLNFYEGSHIKALCNVYSGMKQLYSC